ncbi:MAG: hypothetical protein LC128_07390 [Chitinophagales bacterium]|nr:hypothetical protein [Chitinophagales bacterium]
MLKIAIGNNIKEIQRKSYRTPIKKEGKRSVNEKLSGQKAKKVASLKPENIKTKIRNNRIIQRMVFGIFNRTSMIVYALGTVPEENDLQKKIIYCVSTTLWCYFLACPQP